MIIVTKQIQHVNIIFVQKAILKIITVPITVFFFFKDGESCV